MEVVGAHNDTVNKRFTSHLPDKIDKLIALDDDKVTFAAIPGTKKKQKFEACSPYK